MQDLRSILKLSQINLIYSSANGGQLLLSGEKIEGVGMLYSVEGQNFFAIETKKSDGTWERTDFAVPNFMETVAKEAFQQRKIQQMTQLFDEGSAHQLSEGAVKALAQRSEVKILQEAAQKLGAMGVTGVDNKGALLFYKHCERERPTCGETKACSREYSWGSNCLSPHSLDCTCTPPSMHFQSRNTV